MVQRWQRLLFAHWRCPLSDLRPLVRAPLEIETYQGEAWVGVLPFLMTGVRVRGMPPIPTANRFEELNVRTYVTLDGRPGIWFFSLDAASTLAVLGARAGISLPYFRASMHMSRHGETISYRSERWSIAGKPAAFACSYRPVGAAATPEAGTLDHFLTERYAFYSSNGNRLWRGDIYHPRWKLQRAEAAIDRNSMLAAAGLGQPGHAPLLHFAAFQDVRLWRPVRVR